MMSPSPRLHVVYGPANTGKGRALPGLIPPGGCNLVIEGSASIDQALAALATPIHGRPVSALVVPEMTPREAPLVNAALDAGINVWLALHAAIEPAPDNVRQRLLALGVRPPDEIDFHPTRPLPMP